MMRFFCLLLLPLLLTGCDSYLEERQSFLELPFEYEGRLDRYGFEPGWDLAWGVPDNGDSAAVYLGTWWGDLYYWEHDHASWIGSLTGNRRIASAHRKGLYLTLDGPGLPGEISLQQSGVQLDATDGLMTDVNSLIVSSSTAVFAGNLHHVPLADETVAISFIPVDSTVPAVSPGVQLLPDDSLLFSTLLDQAFPAAGDVWGSATVDFHAFAPASLGSYSGEHKFIVSRSDSLTGRRKTVLASVFKDFPYTLTTRVIDASADFHFVNRNSFVGMKGEELRVFSANGELLDSYHLEGMRLLGVRSGVEQELVFLYSSDEGNGERVYGIYSLPATFIREAE